ncbi:hypothetical protein VdG2_06743 [Verticillium dahliae VDG2]|nr:hypothetical protein VdG2_06743 [Verticillium dahliae VDG2]
MEKFSQFRDKGSGISPFMPIKTPVSPLTYALHTSLFLLRLPLFLTLTATYFLFLHHLPLPVVVRKALLWSLMAIPGLWWIDLQLDGVRRGTLADQPPSRFPHPASVIASTLTSPIDALYLAAIFDPIFTRAYPSTRKLERVSLLDVTRRGGGADGADGADVTMEEQRVLDKVAEALARLGRNKRVGLTLKDKAAFVDAWNRRTKR